jgi:hypothetical protein
MCGGGLDAGLNVAGHEGDSQGETKEIQAMIHTSAARGHKTANDRDNRATGQKETD